MHTLTVVLLDNGDAPHGGKALKVPHECCIRFTLHVGSSVCIKAPKFHTNYPVLGTPFDRNFFYEVPSTILYDGIYDWTAQLQVSKAGCYDYYISYCGADGTVHQSLHGSFYSDPHVTLNGVYVPVEAIVIQTVMPKSLGVFSEWESRLRLASQLGYNMLHFTPVQELGQSQSCYSLYDQLQLNSKLFTSHDDNWDKLREFLCTLEKQYGLLSMTDVVWNHTADNTPWLLEHPEAGYNLQNSPHLKAAYDLDDAVLAFSHSLLNAEGVGPYVDNEEALSSIMSRLEEAVFPTTRLWEYYVVNVSAHLEQFKAAVLAGTSFSAMYGEDLLSQDRAVKLLEKDGLYILPDGERNSYCVRLECALAIFNMPKIAEPSADVIAARCAAYEKCLNILNVAYYEKYNGDVDVALRNMTERVRYERVSAHGPRLGPLTAKRPLVDSYFTRLSTTERADVSTTEKRVWPIALANNGWIYNDNPLSDFAAPSNARNAYFRREVIVWGDCVKLRYGKRPEDNPWLWEHMRQYTELMAGVFHAFRIDNCHSTPIHVAQYLLDAARRVRPEIYVICELFTGSEEIDAVFVSKLGITALIREAMGAVDSWELGRLCHRHGGTPVGSLDCVESIMHASPGLPGALFADCTHDNETPAQKRDPRDALSNAALVAAAACGIGSVRGYDELVPQTLNVVTEKRLYSIYDGNDGLKVGIQNAKAKLNTLHQQMAFEGFSQLHVHQSHNTIAIQRHNPTTHEAVYIVVHTAFSRDGEYYGQTVRVPGDITSTLFAGRLEMTNQPPSQDKASENFITGLLSTLHWRDGPEVSQNSDHYLSIQVVPENGDVYPIVTRY